MIKAINRVRHTCIWLTVLFLVIFCGFFVVNETAQAGSWSALINQFIEDVSQEDGC